MYRLRANLPPTPIADVGQSRLLEIRSPATVLDAAEKAPPGTVRSRRSRMHAKRQDIYFAGYAPPEVLHKLIDLGLLPIEDAEDRQAIGRALVDFVRSR